MNPRPERRAGRGTTRYAPAAPTPLTRPRFALIALALALLIPLITLAFFRLEMPRVERDGFRNLESVARLQSEQIERWLAERQRDALEVAASGDLLALVAARARDAGDSASDARLRQTLGRLLADGTYDSVLLLDHRGRLLIGLGGRQALSPATLDLAAQAVDSRQVRRGDIQRDAAGHVSLDWAIPMLVPDARGGHAAATLIQRVALEGSLLPMLQSWPTVSDSAETLLVRSEGDLVLYLNPLRHRTDPPLTLTLPLTSPLPGAIAIKAPGPGTTRGRDYRGVEVLAAYRPVAGTPWRIVAQISREELMAPLWSAMVWLVLIASAAATVVLLALRLLWRQQQQLHQLDLLAQSSKANRLLVTLADNSTDAIFVKDLEGRYQLVNREAARVAGKTVEQLLGQNDTALFPAGEAEAVRANDRRVMAGGRIQNCEEPLTTVDGERLFLATKGPLRADDGTLLGLFGISRDITERHRADLALKAQSRALSERNHELERFNHVAVARELDMIALKRQVNELSRRLGLAPPFALDFVPVGPDAAPGRPVPGPRSTGHA